MKSTTVLIERTTSKQAAIKYVWMALITVALMFGTMSFAQAAHAANKDAAPTPAKLSLITKDADEGFALAVKLSQKGVATTQTDVATRKRLRPEYAEDPDSLIHVSHVIAVHFQTIAAANNYWRDY